MYFACYVIFRPNNEAYLSVIIEYIYCITVKRNTLKIKDKKSQNKIKQKVHKNSTGFVLCCLITLGHRACPRFFDIPSDSYSNGEDQVSQCQQLTISNSLFLGVRSHVYIILSCTPYSLNLCTFCVYCYSFWEFIYVLILLCLEDIFVELSITSDSSNPSVSSSLSIL